MTRSRRSKLAKLSPHGWERPQTPVNPPQETSTSAPYNSEENGLSGLLSLPFDVLLLIVKQLSPRELQPARLACRLLATCANITCETLTIKDDMAQYVLNDPTTHQLRQVCGKQLPSPATAAGPSAPPPSWLDGLLARYPNVRMARLQCHSRTLSIVLQSMLRSPAGEALVRAFAQQLSDVEPWHAAAVFACLVKHLVVLNRLPDALVVLEWVELLAELPRDLAQAAAMYERGYESASTLVPALCAQVCRVAQTHLSGHAFLFVKKIRPLLLSASCWRWLMYCLVHHSHLNLSVEAIKVVHYGTLMSISPTCYDEVFRMLFEAQIDKGRHLDVLATRPRGSWVNNLYHGTQSYPSKVLKDGALERLCMVLMCRRQYSVVLGLMKSMSSEELVKDVWAQLAAATGVMVGWEGLLNAECVEQMLQLTPELSPSLRVWATSDLLRVLVARGLVHRALAVAALVPNAACDVALWGALRSTYCLDRSAVLATLSKETRALVLQVALQLRDQDMAASALLVWVTSSVVQGDTDSAMATARGLPLTHNCDAVWVVLCEAALARGRVADAFECAGRVSGAGLLQSFHQHAAGSAAALAGALGGAATALAAPAAPPAMGLPPAAGPPLPPGALPFAADNAGHVVVLNPLAPYGIQPSMLMQHVLLVHQHAQQICAHPPTHPTQQAAEARVGVAAPVVPAAGASPPPPSHTGGAEAGGSAAPLISSGGTDAMAAPTTVAWRRLCDLVLTNRGNGGSSNAASSTAAFVDRLESHATGAAEPALVSEYVRHLCLSRVDQGLLEGIQDLAQRWCKPFVRRAVLEALCMKLIAQGEWVKASEVLGSGGTVVVDAFVELSSELLRIGQAAQVAVAAQGLQLPRSGGRKLANDDALDGVLKAAVKALSREGRFQQALDVCCLIRHRPACDALLDQLAGKALSGPTTAIAVAAVKCIVEPRLRTRACRDLVRRLLPIGDIAAAKEVARALPGVTAASEGAGGDKQHKEQQQEAATVSGVWRDVCLALARTGEVQQALDSLGHIPAGETRESVHEAVMKHARGAGSTPRKGQPPTVTAAGVQRGRPASGVSSSSRASGALQSPSRGASEDEAGGSHGMTGVRTRSAVAVEAAMKESLSAATGGATGSSRSTKRRRGG